MAPLFARTAAACRIAGFDRSQFNDAIKAENYPCAPTARRGQSRIFDVNDIVTLYECARLMASGVPPRTAGAWACLIREYLARHSDAEFVAIVHPDIGSAYALDARDINFDRPVTSSGLSVARWIIFHVGRTRSLVEYELTAESKIVGEDD